MRGSAPLRALGFLVVLILACSGWRAIQKTSARPPSTRVAPVTDTLHGVEIVDQYRWLEEDTAEVAAWTDAENRYARAVLDHLPGRKALEDRLRPCMTIGAVGAPITRGNRYFFARRTPSERQPIVYMRGGALGADTMLVDPASLDPSGLTTVAWISPSEDGKVLAYGITREGQEGTTLQLLDVDTVKPQSLAIPNVLQPAQWLPNGSGFVYQNLRSAQDPFSRQGLFHRMTTEPATDRLLYRQFTQAEDPRLARTRGPFATLSADGHWLVLGYWSDARSNDLWLANFDDFLRTGTLTTTTVSQGVDGQAFGAVVDGTLVVHTTKGAPRGRVVAVSAKEAGSAPWREVIPEKPDAAIQAVTFGRGTIAVTYLKNASTVIEVFNGTGRSLGILDQPGIGMAAITTAPHRTEAYLTFTSFNYPTTVFRVELTTPSATPRFWAGPNLPIDPAIADVAQVWYPSKDSTRISMFLVHGKGLRPTGDTPTLLAGYGAFKISMTPTFSATVFQWIEAGGLFAVPNLRGGGEYGDAWHQAGMLDKKQTVFDDFIAAAEWLIANKYTTPQKLAIYGNSQGGLLTGAAITERPDLFRAALVLDPVLDMLRYHKFLSGRYWVPEYGSAEDAGPFKSLLAYSPYHRVRPATKYPAVLLMASERATDVHPLHARKMAAALQAATASDQAFQPVLIEINRGGDVSSETLRNRQLRDLVDQRLFVMWQLGMLR